jgi:molecular chaperone GrpE (heat shock protein)
LFKEACTAANQPKAVLTEEQSSRRAAEEAEWAQYQAEERKRAEEFAKILEQEAAERRARKEEELRLARLRAIQEAEQFAKAASEDLCWDIVTDSDKVTMMRTPRRPPPLRLVFSRLLCLLLHKASRSLTHSLPRLVTQS